MARSSIIAEASSDLKWPGNVFYIEKSKYGYLHRGTYLPSKTI